MAKEEVKRLAPLKDTLRELYLKSGNQCAFPGCKEVMINDEGEFIGQVCHIEAAEKGGERFNSDMSNEDRRAFSNLMLLCYPHHVKTDDVKAYPLELFKKMKADHEAKFTDIAGKIENTITDKATAQQSSVCSTLKQINSVLNWGHDDSELNESLSEAKWALERLEKLPPRTRSFLAIVVSRLPRVDLPRAGGQKYRYVDEISAGEMQEACDILPAEIKRHMEILEKYEIGRLDVDNFMPNEATIRLKETPEGWFIWGDLREYCDRQGFPLTAFIEDLRFNLLDAG